MSDEESEAFERWYLESIKTDKQLIGKALVLLNAFLAGVQEGSEMIYLTSQQFAYEQPPDGWTDAQEKQIDKAVKATITALREDCYDWIPPVDSDEIFDQVVDDVRQLLSDLLEGMK